VAIPAILVFFVLYASLKGVKVFDSFVEGAKEGFGVVVTIIPYAVGMLVAIFMFRASGCVDTLTNLLRPAMSVVGFPPEILPMALIRPLSNSGANAVLMDLCKTFGPDHPLARMAGTIMGSTETTFYVVAVYFGAVGIRRTRHALAAGLLADFAGVVASVIICRAVFQ
jgi:spore maturation protein B